MRPAPWVLGVVVLGVVFAAVTLTDPSGRTSGPPLDPGSTAHDGARAAVILLEETGIAVQTGDVPSPGRVGSLVVLVDDLDDDAWRGVRSFVESGGDLVVADPYAELAAPVDATVTGDSPLEGPCGIPELAAVAELDVMVFRTFRGEGPGCLQVGDGSAARVAELGEGRVLSLGTAHPFRNDALARADHAALVAGVGQWATPPVRVLVRGPVGTGQRSLWSLVPVWVWAVLAQLGVAVGFYALWRAVRLGAPMVETDPVEVDDKSLVRALAVLTDRSGDDGAVADALVRRWRHELGGRDGDPRNDRELVGRLGLSAEDADLVLRSLGENIADPLTRAALVQQARRVVAGFENEPTAMPGRHPAQEVDV
jgi:hypothetical protein